MTDFEVHLSLEGEMRQIGRARSNRVRGKETVIFEYTDEWLSDTNRFELEPGLPLTRGGFAPPTGQNIHGALGDSAPDTWGRRLMQRAERRQAVSDHFKMHHLWSLQSAPPLTGVFLGFLGSFWQGVFLFP